MLLVIAAFKLSDVFCLKVELSLLPNLGLLIYDWCLALLFACCCCRLAAWTYFVTNTAAAFKVANKKQTRMALEKICGLHRWESKGGASNAQYESELPHDWKFVTFSEKTCLIVCYQQVSKQNSQTIGHIQITTGVRQCTHTWTKYTWCEMYTQRIIYSKNVCHPMCYLFSWKPVTGATKSLPRMFSWPGFSQV